MSDLRFAAPAASPVYLSAGSPVSQLIAASPVQQLITSAAVSPVQFVSASPVQYISASPVQQVAVAAASPVQQVVTVAAAPAELPLPVLPQVNASCYAPPAVAPGVNTAQVVQLPTEQRLLETNDADLQTIVRENSNHTTYNKTVVTTVNRNHLHTQRIVDNHSQHNTYITNNVVKVNDIHRQRVENVQGERRVFNDYKQSQVVEPARCLRAADGALVACNSQ
jgi:hypothetical protein